MKKFYGIFPLPGSKIYNKNELNKLSVKWIMLTGSFLDVFSSNVANELEEGKDLSKSKAIKPPLPN